MWSTKAACPRLHLPARYLSFPQNKHLAQQQCLANPAWNNNNMNVGFAICCSSFESRNVYFNSETSMLQWKSKLRNAWGQYKHVSTLGRCCRYNPVYGCASAADLIGCMRTLLACWTPRTVAKAGMMSLPLTAWQHMPSPRVAACPTKPSPIFTHSTMSYVTVCTHSKYP